MPLADTPTTTSRFVRRSRATLRAALLVVVLDAFFRREDRFLAAGHDCLHERGGVPNVGGISAASTTPSRPLVPAPTKTMRPPLRSACVMISMPWAIVSFSLCTAATTLRSSFTTISMMSRTGVLSIARLAGLICFGGERLPLRMGLHGRVRPPHPGARTANRVRYSLALRCCQRSGDEPPRGGASNGPGGTDGDGRRNVVMASVGQRCPARPGGPPRHGAKSPS